MLWFFFFKQKTAYEMRISDWSSDVCSSDLTTVAGQPLPSLAPMLEKVTPAVVSVRTRQVVRVSPFGNDPFFRRMFPELTQQQLNQSLGSGVLIDEAHGYVLTKHHVIAGEDPLDRQYEV